MGLIYKFQEGGSVTKEMVNRNKSKENNIIAKGTRSNSESTSVSKPLVKSLKVLAIEKMMRDEKEQPVISQGRTLTEQEQKTSNKINKRLDSKKKWENTIIGDLGIDPNDIGITAGNIASKASRFSPMTEEEIISTTNNTKNAIKFTNEIAVQTLANELVGGLLKKPLGIAYSAGANKINRATLPVINSLKNVSLFPANSRLIYPGLLNHSPKITSEIIGNVIVPYETSKKLLKKSVISPSKINTELSEDMLPFISKVTPSYTKEEKIFNSFLSPESQAKKIKDATKHYDKNGNLLKNKNFYTEDIDVSSFQLEDLDNSDAVEKTLSDFKNRINTKEGLKRAKKLNINVDKLNKLKSNTAPHDDIAFYDNNVINVSSQIPKKHISNISRHEIEHAIQHAAPYNGHPVAFTKIDESLNELILKNDSELFDNYEHPPGRTVSEAIENTLNRPGEAKEYFKRISEKSAFLSEVQQSMLDNKIIKHAYEKITPETVKKLKHTLDTKNDNSLRLMNIIKDDELNYKIIARNLNRMLAVPGVTAGLLYKNNKDNGNTK